jgi:uncharacterized Fe-S radical SAM superfamily protein PflX
VYCQNRDISQKGHGEFLRAKASAVERGLHRPD